MNYHALAPAKYKRSVISGMVYRIYHACSTWQNFHDSLTKARRILENNQYPPSFYDPIVERTLNKIREPERAAEEEDEEAMEKKMIFLQYRGKITENFERKLNRINAPCKIVMTIRKIKTVMPSLKIPVDKALRSGLVYKITCSRCQSCYVGQTTRHLLVRLREHKRAGTPVESHFRACDTTVTMEAVEIIGACNKSVYKLMTLEALFIRSLRPSLNTKDEYKSRTLTIKI